MARNKFSNSKGKKFLAELPVLCMSTSGIEKRSKFNFSFFDLNQEPCTGFDQLTHEQLQSVVEKIKSYSRESLSYWQNQRCGGGGLNVFEIYDRFPERSEFKHPAHVPHDARWARFRLDNLGRLVGFVVPADSVGSIEEQGGFLLDTNTFYVVFIDLGHRFYRIGDR